VISNRVRIGPIFAIERLEVPPLVRAGRPDKSVPILSIV